MKNESIHPKNIIAVSIYDRITAPKYIKPIVMYLKVEKKQPYSSQGF